MSTTTETTEQPTVETSGAMALIAKYRQDFATVLPSHVKPETWVRLSQGVLRRDEKLRAVADRNPASLLNCLLDAARQGLNPGTEEYYLVPFGSEVQGIRGYQGEIELMYRAGAISSVIVEVVRQHDKFAYVPGRDERPVHEIDWDLEDRGNLRLAYAYAVMKDGATSKVVVLNKRHIDDAKRMSKGSDKPTSPWLQHAEAMWMKTAAHRLQKWVPTSAEYIREQYRAIRDVQAEQAAAVPPATEGPIDLGTIRATTIDHEPDAPTPPAASGAPAVDDAEGDEDGVPVDGVRMRRMFALLREKGVTDRPARLRLLSAIVGDNITSSSQLSEGQVAFVIQELTVLDQPVIDKMAGAE